MQDIDEYQNESNTKRMHKENINHPVVYPALGLAGEVGEFCEKIKKILRDNDAHITATDIQALKLELGDIMWYVVVCSEALGLKMSDILEANLKKLESRRLRNKIKGSGDIR